MLFLLLSLSHSGLLILLLHSLLFPLPQSQSPTYHSFRLVGQKKSFAVMPTFLQCHRKLRTIGLPSLKPSTTPQAKLTILPTYLTSRDGTSLMISLESINQLPHTSTHHCKNRWLFPFWNWSTSLPKSITKWNLFETNRFGPVTRGPSFTRHRNKWHHWLTISLHGSIVGTCNVHVPYRACHRTAI